MQLLQTCYKCRNLHNKYAKMLVVPHAMHSKICLKYICICYDIKKYASTLF